MQVRLYTPNLVKDFCNILGISETSLDIPQQSKISNCGYSRMVLEIARSANVYMTLKQTQALRHILQEIDTKKPFESYAFFTKDERDQFMSNFMSSNADVLQKYFPGNEEQLFSNFNFEECDTREFQFSTDKAIAILAAAIGKLAYQIEQKR